MTQLRQAFYTVLPKRAFSDDASEEAHMAMAGMVFTFLKGLVEDRFNELNRDHHQPSESDDYSFPEGTLLFTRDPNNRDWPLPRKVVLPPSQIPDEAEVTRADVKAMVVEAATRLTSARRIGEVITPLRNPEKHAGIDSCGS